MHRVREDIVRQLRNSSAIMSTDQDRASHAQVRDCPMLGASAQSVGLSPGRHILGLRSMPSMRMPYSFRRRNTWL